MNRPYRKSLDRRRRPVVRQVPPPDAELQGNWPAEYFGSAESFLDSVPPGQSGYAIVDIDMPGCDGFELMQKMRYLHYGMPVIIVTGRSDSQARDLAMQNGASDICRNRFPRNLCRNDRFPAPFLSLQCISEAEASKILIFVSVHIDERKNAGKRRMPVLSVRSILENDL